ncbi:MAG: SagB family peptide dehydrogenase [Microbacteriaceae bacterium]
MSRPLLLALRSEVTLDRSTGRARMAAPWAGLPLPDAAAPERAPVDRLLRGPASADELNALASATGTTGLARWMLWSARARQRGLLCYRLQADDGALLADLVATTPAAPDFMIQTPGAVTGVRVQLSRFAVLHRGRQGMILESPCATMRAEVSPEAAAALAAFAVPMTVDDAPQVMQAFGAAESRTFLAALLAAGLLGAVGDDGLMAEERDAVLSQWEFQDLLLHARSRTNRPDEPRGATFRFAGIRPAPPAVNHAGTAPEIILERPDLARLIAEDPPLARVMEDRASRRDLGKLTISQLGEFLFRTMRVRGMGPPVIQPHDYPATARPYPSAGGMYELTTYLAVSDCTGLPAGLYRYDPLHHGLNLVAPPGPHVDRLLVDASSAALLPAAPPVLVLLAADFRRLSWKYEGIAYSLMLKNVGVLFQSMQLAAVAMGLGSCPLGAGDSEVFARAARTDALEESSVGELLLGS